MKRNEPEDKSKKRGTQLEEELRQRMSQNAMDMVSATTRNRSSNKKRIEHRYNMTQQIVRNGKTAKTNTSNQGHEGKYRQQ